MTESNAEYMKLVRSHRGEGLPAVDPKSIEALVYLRVSRISHDNNEENNYGYTTLTRDGTLPVLIAGRSVVKGDQIVDYLQKYYVDLDKDLSEEDKQLSKLFRKLIYTTLHPAYEFFMWGCGMCDTEFDSQSPAFFAQKALARFRMQRAMNANFVLRGLNTSDDAILQAVPIIHDLAVRLGQHMYFFGNSFMTSLDIAVASTVAVIITRKLPNGSPHPLAYTIQEHYPWLIRHMLGVMMESKIAHFEQIPENIYTVPSYVEPRLEATYKGEIIVSDQFVVPDFQTGSFADEVSPHVVMMYNIFGTEETKEMNVALPEGTKIVTLSLEEDTPSAFCDIVASLTKTEWRRSVGVYPMVEASRYINREVLSPEAYEEAQRQEINNRSRLRMGIFTFAGMVSYMLYVRGKRS